jgi:putative aminopeptidase FrvX
MARDLQLLKEVLSVPTYTYQEDLMVQFIVDWLKSNNIEHYVDEHLNVYAIKQTGELPEDFVFPCVVAHTDTVHKLDTINVREEMLPNSNGELKLSLKAYNDNGLPTGIGGDDKCGVFACFELLKELPNLKAAFFVSEETGCHGSKMADPSFFTNVGYAIQFDAPENWMVTETCYGARLFDREGEFFEKCDKVLNESMNEKRQYMVHPYTDVYALKTKFDFSCINFSIGYYRYHTNQEYVVVEDTFNGVDMGKQMIESLGYQKYTHERQKSSTFRYW